METFRSELRIQTACLLILTAAAITGTMYFFQSVLVPFVLAIFLTYGLMPVIDIQMRKFHIPKFAAVVSTIIIGCILMFVAAIFVSAAVAEIAENKDDYMIRIQQMTNRFLESDMLDKIGVDAEELSKNIFSMSTETAKGIFTSIASSIMGLLSNGLLVVIFMIFMMAGKSVRKNKKGSLWAEIENKIKRYIIAMGLTSAVTGLLVGVTLSLLNVDFAWMFGFLAFLLNFIPNIGSILATLLPIPVIILNPELSPFAKTLAIIIPSVIQFVIGNLIQPKMMGQSLDLHPVVVLLSLIFFGTIWGVVGMFLATPITAVIRMLLEKFEFTRPVAMLLSGKVFELSD